MPKNLLVVTRSTIFHSQTGGIETQLNNLLQGLQENYKITVITTALPVFSNRFEDNETYYKYHESENLEYLFIKDTNVGKLDIQLWQKILYELSIFSKLKKKLLVFFRLQNNSDNFAKGIRSFLNKNKDHIDLIISQSTSLGYEDTHGIPLVTVIHGTISGELKGRYSWLASVKSYIRFFIYDLPYLLLIKYTIDKSVYERSNMIVAVSDNLKNSFLENYPRYNNKTHVIYNGVDEKLLMNNKEFKHPLKVIYVGKIDIEKGVEVIKDVIKHTDFKNHNIEYTIIGDGDYYLKLNEATRELNLPAKIKLLGKQPQSVVYENFKEAHIFLFPTLRVEGHPMVLIESMLSGTVPMVNPLGGIKDVVNNSNSMIIDTNYQNILNKLYYLHDNLSIVETLSHQTLNDGQKYSQSKMVENYDKIFKSLIIDI